MPERFQNYRKAKRGDIRCCECVHSFMWPPQPRLRCGSEQNKSQAVGKNMTCDFALRK